VGGSYASDEMCGFAMGTDPAQQFYGIAAPGSARRHSSTTASTAAASTSFTSTGAQYCNNRRFGSRTAVEEQAPYAACVEFSRGALRRRKR
jgi:hypothetical protein